MHQYFGGGLRRGRGSETQAVVDPATGRTLVLADLAGPADVDEAVAAARRAFPVWSRATPAQRAEVLNRLAAIFGRSRPITSTSVGRLPFSHA